jgi:hypothetical protein
MQRRMLAVSLLVLLIVSREGIAAPPVTGPAPATGAPAPAPGFLDWSMGDATDKPDFPKGPDLPTFDAAFANAGVLDRFQTDLRNAQPVLQNPFAVGGTYSNYWDQLEQLTRDFESGLEKKKTAYNNARKEIWEPFAKAAQELCAAYSPEMARAGNAAEQKAIRMKYARKYLALARPAYASLYDAWKKRREDVYFECLDYYDVCASLIRKLPLGYERQCWQMNERRAGKIAGHVAGLWEKDHPAWRFLLVRGMPFRNDGVDIPLAQAYETEVEECLEPCAAQEVTARWRIPSTRNSALGPLVPTPPKRTPKK